MSSDAKPAEPPAEAAPADKHAGRRLEWPTLWSPLQIPFPWGSARRLTKAQERAQRKAAKEAAQ
jgi:hypothetical protein